jgi:prevent-host-death family protein
MEITATEFKSNFGRYLAAVDREDVVITRNGKPVARLVSERAYASGAAELDKLLMVHENAVDIYNSYGAGASGSHGTSDASGSPGSPGAPDAGAAAVPELGIGEWLLTHDGEPVAKVTPIIKKKKRMLGFMGKAPASDKEIAALLESEWTEEDEEEWLSKL